MLNGNLTKFTSGFLEDVTKMIIGMQLMMNIAFFQDSWTVDTRYENEWLVEKTFKSNSILYLILYNIQENATKIMTFDMKNRTYSELMKIDSRFEVLIYFSIVTML